MSACDDRLVATRLCAEDLLAMTSELGDRWVVIAVQRIDEELDVGAGHESLAGAAQHDGLAGGTRELQLAIELYEHVLV